MYKIELDEDKTWLLNADDVRMGWLKSNEYAQIICDLLNKWTDSAKIVDNTEQA